LLGLTYGDEVGGESVVTNLLKAGLERFDAMDQAEILCAKRLIELSQRAVQDGTERTLRLMLHKLPAACTIQLIALEVLPAYHTPEDRQIRAAGQLTRLDLIGTTGLS
jgi:hypothetical protein